MPKFLRYVTIAALVTALSFPVAWFAVRQTDAFAVAKSDILKSECVRSALGEVQSIDLQLVGYSIRMVGPSGSARFNVDVKGTSQSGVVYIELEKQGVWQTSRGRLVLQDGGAIDWAP